MQISLKNTLQICAIFKNTYFEEICERLLLDSYFSLTLVELLPFYFMLYFPIDIWEKQPSAVVSQWIYSENVWKFPRKIPAQSIIYLLVWTLSDLATIFFAYVLLPVKSRCSNQDELLHLSFTSKILIFLEACI